MFGNTNNKSFTFGSGAGTSAFGSNTNNALSTSTGFGGFGAQANKPTGGIFGGTSGTTNTGGLFGGGASTTGGGGGIFGSSGTTTGTGGGLFGNQASSGAFGSTQSSGGLFGNKATSGFGGGTTGGLFGGSNSGATTGTGLFGGQTNTDTRPIFGSIAANNNAGGTANAAFGASSSGGIFGASNASSQGTASHKFIATEGSDSMMKNGVSTSIKTKHYCISAMTQYNTKSLEELRLEDYANNLKGPKPGGITTGAPSTGGIFGTTNQPSASSTGFNFAASKPAATGGIFGATTGTTGTGLFGSNTNAITAFGTQTNTSGSIFGNTQNKPNVGIFGNTATVPAFGQTTTSTAPTVGLFGNKPTTGFGTTTGSTGFGTTNNQTTGGIFGNKTAFGTTTNTGSTGFSFGQTTGQTTANTFGFGVAAVKPSGFNFASGTNQTFAPAAQTAQPQNNQPVQLTTTNPDITAIHAKVLALSHSPYGDSPLFRTAQRPENAATNSSAQKAVLEKQTAAVSPNQRVSARPAQKLRMNRNTNVSAIGVSGSASDIFEELDGSELVNTPNKKNVKRLVLRSSPAVNKSSSQFDDSFTSSLNRHTERVNSTESFNLDPPPGTPRRTDTPQRVGTPLRRGDVTSKGTGKENGSDTFILPNKRQADLFDDTLSQLKTRTETPDPPTSDPVMSVPVTDELVVEDRSNPCGVILNRSDYYTEPPINQLHEYWNETGRECLVENFNVGRVGYGNVFFPGVTDVADLDLDSIVHFRRKEVTIYPDDENKPELGHGLNKKAQVTLDCVWPNDKSDRSPIKSPERLKILSYAEKIEKATARIGAKFIDYRPDTGSWVFEVAHFSKYGLLDEDSDDDNITSTQKQPSATQAKSTGQIKQQPGNQIELKKLKTTHSQPLNQLNTTRTLTPVKQLVLGGTGGLSSGDEENVHPDHSPTLPRFNTPKLYTAKKYKGDDSRQLYNAENMADNEQDEMEEFEPDEKPESHWLSTVQGVEASNIQRMKASFIEDDEDFMSPRRSSLTATNVQQASSSYPSLLRYNSPKPETKLLVDNQKSTQSLFNRLGSGESPYGRVDMFKSDQLKGKYEQSAPMSPLLKSDVTSRLDNSLNLPPISLPEPRYKKLAPLSAHQEEPRRKITGIGSLINQIKYDRENTRDKIIDAARVQSHRFRVGWNGPNLLTHLPSSTSQSEPSVLKLKTPTSYSSVMFQQLGNNDIDPALKESCEKLLDIQLINKQTVDNSSSELPPLVEPVIGVESLHEYSRVALNQYESAQCSTSVSEATQDQLKYETLVWALISALWADLLEGSSAPSSPLDYNYLNTRYETFSRWLSYAASENVNERDVFSLLTAHRIADATKLAIKQGDVRLALLISQAGTQSVRDIIQSQISMWLNSAADRSIDEDKLRLYCLLGGVFYHTTSNDKVISCYEGLDWIRCLAIHFWYGAGDWTINSAVLLYDEAVSSNLAAAPLSVSAANNDLLYQLIKLYLDKTYDLSGLISSESSSDNALNYHTAWHVLQTLRSLGYQHLNDWQITQTHIRYSSYLESIGLWSYSLLPLLNITDSHTRNALIESVLLRHIQIDSDEQEYTDQESFIVRQLRISSKLIYKVKAIKCSSQEDPQLQVFNLIHSEQFKSAHDIIIQTLAPRCVLNRTLNTLSPLLQAIVPEANTISDWAVGGKIYMEFIYICEEGEQISGDDESDTEEADYEGLLRKIKIFCQYLSALQVNTPLQQISQSYMAKQVAVILRELAELNPNTDLNTAVLQPISNLPLNNADCIKELRQIMAIFMKQY